MFRTCILFIILYLTCLQINLGQTCPTDNQSAFIDFTIGGTCPSDPILVNVSSAVNQDTGDACCFVDGSANNNTCTSISVVVPSGTCIKVTGSSQSATDWFYTWDATNQCQNGVDLDANQDYEITLPDPSGIGVFEIMYCKNGSLSSADITIQNVACCELDVVCPATSPDDISCSDAAPAFITDIAEFSINATNPLDGSDCSAGLIYEIKSSVDSPDPTDPMALACTGGANNVTVTRTYTIGTVSDMDCIEDVICTQTYTIVADCCCAFTAECPADPLDLLLGDFDCTETIPDCPSVNITTDPISGDITAITVDNPTGDYGITVGVEPCGTIGVLCVDSEVVDFCLAGGQMISRTITVFDDTGDGAGGPPNDILDAGEEFQSCVYTFNITQAAAPTITCPVDDETSAMCYDDITAIAAAGVAALEPGGSLAGNVVVACGNDYTISSAIAVETDNCNDTDYLITYTVTEIGCTPARTASCMQTITLNNNAALTVTCPADVTTGLDCNSTMLPPEETTLAGTDNCGIMSFGVTNVSTEAIPTTFCSADDLSIERVYTVADVCGNSAMCTQLFIFAPDTAPPTISCPQDIITGLQCGDDIPVINSIDEFLAQGGTILDTCPTDFVISSVIAPAGGVTTLNYCTADAADRTITVTYTIMDACGNSSTCIQTFIFDSKPIPDAGQW